MAKTSKQKNTQDTTLRNLRAIKKIVAVLTRRVKALERDKIRIEKGLKFVLKSI